VRGESTGSIAVILIDNVMHDRPRRVVMFSWPVPSRWRRKRRRGSGQRRGTPVPSPSSVARGCSTERARRMVSARRPIERQVRRPEERPSGGIVCLGRRGAGWSKATPVLASGSRTVERSGLREPRCRIARATNHLRATLMAGFDAFATSAPRAPAADVGSSRPSTRDHPRAADDRGDPGNRGHRQLRPEGGFLPSNGACPRGRGGRRRPLVRCPGSDGHGAD
jgi:hypothetical protein